MPEQKPTEPQEQQELSQEEINKLVAQRQAFYESQLPLIKIQSEYERLLADIEESRYRKVMYIIKIAQATAGPPDEKEEDLQSAKPEPEKRKLKNE